MKDLASLPARVASVELQIVQLRDEMRLGFSAVRREIRESDQETRRFMRVLHEEMIARIAALGDSRR